MVKAAIVANKGTDSICEIGETQIRLIENDEILVETKAVAINPADWKTAEVLPPGSSFGSDGAGVVIEVGEDVKGFKRGDYIASGVCSFDERAGTFSTRFISKASASINVTSLIKDTFGLSPGEYKSSGLTSFEAAASVTCGLITAAQVFNEALKIDTNKQVNKGKYILVWGGAGATGIIVTQLAKAIYGLKVIVTASTHSEFLKAIGADHVVNYKDSDAVDQIKKLTNGKIAYALDAVGTLETFQATYDATIGSETIAIDNLGVNKPESIKVDKSRNVKFEHTLAFVGLGYETFGVKPTPERLGNFEQFWLDILPPHLNSLKTANLIVLKQGLESVNQGLQLVKGGKVHGSKVVIRI